MTATTVIYGICMIISIGSASVATANMTNYVIEQYQQYVAEHKELYTFGDTVTFETPDGVTVVVESGTAD